MRVEVIHNDHNLLSLGINCIRKLLHGVCPIFVRALIADIHKSFSRQRFEEHEQVCDPFSFVFIIDTFGLAWLSRKGFTQIVGVMEIDLVIVIHRLQPVEWFVGVLDNRSIRRNSARGRCWSSCGRPGCRRGWSGSI